MQLASDMYPVWVGGADHAEGVARCVGLLRSGAGSPAVRSRAARNAAIVAARMGESDQALALGEQALDEAAGADSAQERRARQVLAQILLDRGDVAAARRHLTPALPDQPEQTTDVDAFCLVTQGNVDLAAADLDDAAAAAQRVLTGRFNSTGWIGSSVRFLLGEIMFERGDLALARTWFHEELQIGERLGDVGAIKEGHLMLVAIECAAGRIDDADSHFRIASGLRRDTNRGGDLPFLEARATLALHGRSSDEAIDLAEAAFELANDIASAHDRCLCLRLLGDAHLAAGNVDRALSIFEQMIARAGAAPYPCRVAEAHEAAAAAASAGGRRRAAHRHLAAAAKIRGRTGTRRLRRPAVEHRLQRLLSTDQRASAQG